MEFILERLVAPDEEPVTLAEMIEQVSEFSSISQASQDRLTSLIVVAREWVEDYTGRALLTQTWRLTVGKYVAAFANVDSDTVSGYYRGPWYPSSDGGIYLHRNPVVSIGAFVTVDAAGVEAAVDAGTYELREAASKWPRVYALSGANWSTGVMRITFTAGAADSEEVPVRFKQAIKLYAEALYDRDEKMMPALMKGAEDVIRPERANLQFA